MILLVTVDDPDALPNRFRLAVCILTVLALALPFYAIWSRTYVPLHDLPNHMARHYLEYLKLSGGKLPPSYEIEWRVLPNLGSDCLVPPLFLFFEPLTVCKIFLTACVLLYWLGPSLFIWQQGGRGIGALAASVFWLPWLLSSEFFWGFLNYYSGLGLAFLTLTHYCSLRDRSSVLPRQLVLHTALVTLLFFWHLAPWGIYCVMMGCHTLVRGAEEYLRWRAIGPCLARAMLYALSVIPSVLLLGYYLLNQAGTKGSASVDWGGWSRKARMALDLFGDYNAKASATVLALWGIALSSTFGSLFSKKFRRSWLHLAIAVLVVLYLVLPFQLGHGAHIDSRILPAILVAVLASLGTLTIRVQRWPLVLMAICLVVRTGAVVHAWNQLSARLNSHAKAFAMIEGRTRVMPVTLTSSHYTHPEWAPSLGPSFSEMHSSPRCSLIMISNPFASLHRAAYTLDRRPMVTSLTKDLCGTITITCGSTTRNRNRFEFRTAGSVSSARTL